MGVDGPVPSESARTGAGLALPNCVVFLASIAEGKEWPEGVRTADRLTWIRILPGRYEPRVQWTRLGTQLAFESRIPMEINVHGFQGASRRDTVFNFSAQPDAKLADIADCWLRRPGLVFVSDDFRGGFQAYVHLTHPVDVGGRRRPARGARLRRRGRHARPGRWHEASLAAAGSAAPLRPRRDPPRERPHARGGGDRGLLYSAPAPAIARVAA
jgi:hypothetical protein